MNVTITLDDEKVTKLLNEELESFPKEELKELVRDCINEFLKDSKIIEGLFVETRRDGWSGYESKNPSKLLVDAAKTFDLSPAYEEIQELMIKTLKENHRELLEEIMLRQIRSGIMNDRFLCYITDAVDAIINMRKQN